DVATWLRGNVPPMGEPGIIHGDYQLINTLFAHGASARLAAIVDWEQSTIGDPLVDLGWLLAGWHHQGEEPSFTAAYLTDRHGFATRDELVERYADRTPRSGERAGRDSPFPPTSPSRKRSRGWCAPPSSTSGGSTCWSTTRPSRSWATSTCRRSATTS